VVWYPTVGLWGTVMVKPVYFIEEVNPEWPRKGDELGPITFRQEIFCWVYARTHNGMQANRMAYNHKTEGTQNSYACRLLRRPAIRERINQLEAAHAGRLPNIHHPEKRVVSLDDGPWQHYNKWDEGFPIDPGFPSRNAVREKVWKELGRT
jgi:hypothetical protein